MAASGWLAVVFCCRFGSIALGVAALVVALAISGKHQIAPSGVHQKMMHTLSTATVPGGALLLLAEAVLLNREEHLEQQQPPPPPSDVKLFSIFLMLLEWLLAFVTVGVASCALFVDRATTPMVAADVTAWAAGALGAAAAVGLLWGLLRPAQGALQPQA